MDVKVDKTEIGVIIGRFQVPDIHEAHKELIDTVMNKHKKVIVFLGLKPILGSKNNPLDYPTREVMLKKAYPNILVLPLPDMRSDEEWSKQVDNKVREIFPKGSVTLYGSRDGFIPYYAGGFKTVELQSTKDISGTEIRDLVSEEVRVTDEFRRGVIYANYNKFPTAYPTVDVAIYKKETNEVLLGRKRTDPKNKWRMIGGFVSPRTDTSLEEAAIREAYEETGGLSFGKPVYLGSDFIDDWRYKGEVDSIITAFFLLPYSYGHPQASDDIDFLEWFKVTPELEGVIVENHLKLCKMLLSHLLPEAPSYAK